MSNTVAFALAVNPVTNRIYVSTDDHVTVIDGTTHASTRIAGASGPLAVNPLLDRVYVTNNLANNVAVIDASNAVTFVATGANPQALALNPATNEVYVANNGAASVTVLDAANNTTTVPVGPSPNAIAVDPVANRVYVATQGAVTVIDGASKATTPVAVPGNALALAVNPVTRKVYVALDAGSTTIIDGATLATTTVTTGTMAAIARITVNPGTNRIYTARSSGGSGSMHVIDGATNAVADLPSVSPGSSPAISINPVTNMVYVAGSASPPYSVYAIDGDDLSVHSFGPEPVLAIGDVAVDPVTNRVYVTRSLAGAVAIYDGDTNIPTAIPTGTDPGYAAIALDPISNRIFAADRLNNGVAVIDGTSNTATNVPVNGTPVDIAVNVRTHKAYVANAGNPSVVAVNNGLSFASLPSTPVAIAADPVANRIVVALQAAPHLAVVDGADPGGVPMLHDIGSCTPAGLAVNPANGTVYLGCGADGLVAVDEATFGTSRVQGFIAGRVAVNAMTNRVFVENALTNQIVAIEGATNTVLGSVPLQTGPHAIAIDQRHNKVYVTNAGSDSVTVIDGTFLSSSTVAAGPAPGSLTIDPVARKVYVGNTGAGSVTVIDIDTNVSATIGPTSGPAAGIAVNPVTRKVYVAPVNGIVTAITAAPSRLTNHGVNVSMQGGFVSDSETVQFSASVCCGYAPIDPPAIAMKFDLGISSHLDVGSSPYNTGTCCFTPGLEYVRFYALDKMAGTSIEGRASGAAMIGAPTIFAFVVAPLRIVTPSPLATATLGVFASRTIVASGGSGPVPPTFALDSGALPAGMTLSPDGVVSGTPTTEGFFAFTLRVTDSVDASTTMSYAITVVSGDPPRLGNLSTRMQVLTGADVMIGGFVISGTTAKTVVVRARGPSLTAFGVPNALANPTLTLVRSADQAVLAANDDWIGAPNAATIEASGFAPSDDHESAVLVTLGPGAYTAIVAGANGATGVGIVEVFELDHPETPLANISTRGQVLTGADAMIGGFVIQGNGPQKVVIRARGPSLAQYGIANPLANPMLTLVRSSNQAVIATNDDWQLAPNANDIFASGFAPANGIESAILVTLDPGAYTAIVSGADGGTGVGIVEVFNTP